MTQNVDILLSPPSFTRTDYTALRAFCMRIPIERIASLYYSDDSPQVQEGLERFLIAMRDQVIERAAQNNPLLAESLTHARKTGHVPASVLSILVEAADQKTAPPSPADPVSKWFRPRTAKYLREESIMAVGDLVDLINRRGSSWWRTIPRIGEQRAAVIVRWLQQHPGSIGKVEPAPWTPLPSRSYQMLDPAAGTRFPALGSFYLSPALDGSHGVNRSPRFPFISARDDLAAVECYLARFERPHTLRSYRKELERFVMWAVHIARKPLSSLLTDDCEAYKRFLANPAPEFRGAAAARSSALWRPFSTDPMAPESQKYAVTVLRAAFDWFVKVRYLAGNPWTAVTDPRVTKRRESIKVGRALSQQTWDALIGTLTRRSEVADNVQDRIALAAILLMGDSGLRREEAANALRGRLSPSTKVSSVWMLEVVGKGLKERLVPVSPRAIAALQAHWFDRGLNFSAAPANAHLFAPVIIPNTPAARAKHRREDSIAGYSSNAIYNLVRSALIRVQSDLEAFDGETGDGKLVPEDIEQLRTTSPHAFRHTFGTLALDADMPQHVVQEILGHEDASTTKIYARAVEKRIAVEAAKYFGRSDD